MEFEKKLGELESIVTQMESGELSLEAGLKAFEKGIKLARQCEEQLSSAEQKVQTLLSVDEQGQATTEPFESDQ